jgi:chromosome segregation ATPase
MSDQKTVEELQKELDLAQGKINELESKGSGSGSDLEAELEKLRGINKDLINQRDARKKKEEEAEAARLAEQGEYQTLAEQKQAEAEQLAKDIAEKNAILDKYKERDEAEFAELLEKVPDSLKETVSDESLPLGKRLDLAKKLIAEKPAGPSARPAGELHTDSLEEQYKQAVASGDVSLQISLKRQIHEAKTN